MSVLERIALAIAFGVLIPSATFAKVKQVGQAPVLQTASGFAFNYHRIPTAKRLAIAVTWPADISLAPKGKEAVSHLMSGAMLLGGANGRSTGDLKAEFKDLDARFNIMPRSEVVELLLVAPTVSAQSAAQLANAILVKPTFGKVWVKRVKEKMGQRNKHVLGKSLAQAVLISRRYLIGNHPYALVTPFEGESSIQSVTRQDLIAWHGQVFVREGITITASGPASGESVGNIIDKLLDRLPAASQRLRPVAIPVHLRSKGTTIVLVDPKIAKSTVMISTQLPRTNTLRDLRSRLAVQILGQGPHSRLFKKLRSELGLTYRARTRLHPMQAQHLVLTIHGEFESSKLPAAVAALKNVYGEFLQYGVQASELEAAQTRYAMQRKRWQKLPMRAAMMMMGARKSDMSPAVIFDAPAYIEDLQLSDINNDIRELWPHHNKLIIVVVTSNPSKVDADCVVHSIKEVSSCD